MHYRLAAAVTSRARSPPERSLFRTLQRDQRAESRRAASGTNAPARQDSHWIPSGLWMDGRYENRREREAEVKSPLRSCCVAL